jgi:hypothetical protein
MLDPLAQYQADILNLLLGDPNLAVVPMFKYKSMVAQDAANQALNLWTPRFPALAGVGIQIQLPSVRPKYPNVPGPQLEVEITVRIFEDPINNNTGLTAESIGMEVLAWLDGQNLYGGADLVPDPSHPALRPNKEYADRFCYDAVFVAPFPQDARARALAPAVSDNGAGLVTLGGGEPGAAVYYTTDGSLPVVGGNQNGFGVGSTALYAAPFVVVAGALVRAIAYTAGKLPSYPVAAVINIP